jgi:phosphate transport system substrate-binding protein
MVNGILLLIAVIAGALPSAAYSAENLTYSGSSTIGMSILQAGALRVYEEKTGKKFVQVDMPGSGKGIDALLDDAVAMAGVSRALKPQEQKKKLIGTVIGYDGIAVFVHAANPVKSLTKEQLKGIFTGRIRNWMEVGGKDLPIEPNTEIAGEKRATMLEFQDMVMDKEPYGAGFKQIDLPRDQIIETAKNERAICTVSRGLLSRLTPYMRSKVNVVAVNSVPPSEEGILSGAYIISRPLLIVTKGKPSGEVKLFIDFLLSQDGQDIIRRNFVRIKS